MTNSTNNLLSSLVEVQAIACNDLMLNNTNEPWKVNDICLKYDKNRKNRNKK